MRPAIMAASRWPGGSTTPSSPLIPARPMPPCASVRRSASTVSGNDSTGDRHDPAIPEERPQGPQSQGQEGKPGSPPHRSKDIKDGGLPRPARPARGRDPGRTAAGHGMAAAQRAGLPRRHNQEDAGPVARLREVGRRAAALSRAAHRRMSAVEETVPVNGDAGIGKARRRAVTRLDQEGLANQLASLSALSTAALRDRWRDLYGSEAPPALWRSLLIRALAYRLQEQVYGGLKPGTRRWLERVADDVSAGRPIRPEPANGVKPGTRLLREWQGVTHEVVVTEN